MSDEVMTRVVRIISENCEIDGRDIHPRAHIFEDLGVDSLDFLEVTYDIDQQLGVMLPVEDWMLEVKQSSELGRELFVVENIVNYVSARRADS